MILEVKEIITSKIKSIISIDSLTQQTNRFKTMFPPIETRSSSQLKEPPKGTLKVSSSRKRCMLEQKCFSIFKTSNELLTRKLNKTV